jgi:hypothetical protein
VIVNNLHVNRAGIAILPTEAESPLVIDANAQLPFPIALERFKTVTRQGRKVSQSHSGFEAIQSHAGSVVNSRERFDALSSREVSGPLVAVTEDHNSLYGLLCIT